MLENWGFRKKTCCINPKQFLGESKIKRAKVLIFRYLYVIMVTQQKLKKEKKKIFPKSINFGFG